MFMTIEHTDFPATLFMMSDRQSTEEALRETGYHVGVDFQTNKPTLFRSKFRQNCRLKRKRPFLHLWCLIMVSVFSTGVLREVAAGKKRILDAGCGDGTHVLYLARRNPDATVIGYDRSPEAIEKAQKKWERRKYPNVNFSVADHDEYVGSGFDFIYTAVSLIDDNEVPDEFNKWRDSQDIIRRRLARFHGMLSTNGIYVNVWAADMACNDGFAEIAEDSGLGFVKKIFAHSTDFYEPVPTALVFQRR